MFDKLDFIVGKYDKLAEKVSDPAIIANQELWKQHMKEMSDIEPIVKKYKEYRENKQGIEGAKELLEESDDEIREMAKQELSDLTNAQENLEKELKVLLQRDRKSVV